MKQIGKGTFSTAYLQKDGSVLIKSIDRVKAAMAEGFFPSHRLFPTLELVDRGEHFNYYKMKYFPKVTSIKKNLTPRQYRLYLALREIKTPYMRRDANLYQIMYDKFNTLPSEFKREREVIQEALSGLSNYGTDIAFEISPRNVAVQGKKLILLDCFFMANDLRKVKCRL